MSLKMTDLSFVSCFVSYFDNTGYRICVSPLYLPLTAKIKYKVGILAKTLTEKYLEE